MRPTRRKLLASIATGSAFGVAGCGSDGEQSDPATTSRQQTTTTGSPLYDVVVPDQTTDGTYVRVAKLVLSVEGIGAGWVAIHPVVSGAVQLETTYGARRFTPGEYEVVEVPLEEPRSSDTRLVAQLHEEEPVDERFTYPSGDAAVDPTDSRSHSEFQLTVSGEVDPRTTTDTTATTGGGGTTESTTTTPAAETVVFEDGEWSPRRVSIASGETVAWVNRSETVHDVTSDLFEEKVEGELRDWQFSTRLAPGERTTRTFYAAGRFGFVCSRHGLEVYREALTGIDAYVHGECGVVQVEGATYDGELPCESPAERFQPDATVTFRDGTVTPAVVSFEEATNPGDYLARVAFVNADDEPHYPTDWGLIPEATKRQFSEAERTYLEETGLYRDRERARRALLLEPGERHVEAFAAEDTPVGFFCSEHGALQESGAIAIYDDNDASPFHDEPTGATHVDFLPSTDATVTLDGGGFSPRVVEVPAGSVVEWENVLEPASTTTTTTAEGDEEEPHTVSSWNQLDAEGRSQLSDAQLALLDQAADGWAEWDRSLPAQKHAFFSFPTAGVYPYFDRRVGLDGASGAVVVGDATLDVDLPG